MLALGETRGQSGEAAARSEIDLPGRQQQLIDAIKATGKPFVVVLFNGRPLTLDGGRRPVAGDPRGLVPGHRGRQRRRRRAVREGQPGRQAAGVASRARVGQVPIYYNHEPTGPPVRRDAKYNSRYRDLPQLRPAVPVRLRPELHDLRDRQPAAERHERCRATGSVTASVDVTNTGARAGDEVVQLYIHDPVASISQPVRRLRGFERVTLAPG